MAVVRFVLVVVDWVIDVDDNGNGPFSVRSGLEFKVCVLGGDAQVTISRNVRRALVEALSSTYVGHMMEDSSDFSPLTETYARTSKTDLFGVGD